MSQDATTVEKVVATILIRDDFRYQRFNYAVRVFGFVLGLLALSAAGNVALMGSRERFQYLLTDASGKLLKLVPLSQPNKADEEVEKWAVDAVTRLNTFDFANYRGQFLFAQRVLTGVGWRGFQQALVDSGNFTSVIENRYVTTAVPSGPARVNYEGPSQGADGSVRYVWNVTFPILVTYRSSFMSISQGYTVTATVVRMPEFINSDGLGIRQIIGQQSD